MDVEMKILPDLEGREAKCDICKTVQHSSRSLAYFGYKPDQEFDGFYCGCKGWN